MCLTGLGVALGLCDKVNISYTNFLMDLRLFSIPVAGQAVFWKKNHFHEFYQVSEVKSLYFCKSFSNSN